MLVSEKSLIQLDVSQNFLTHIPTAIISLHNLLILNINHNNIKKIEEHAFKGLRTLEILTLYGNKISQISPLGFTEVAR